MALFLLLVVFARAADLRYASSPRCWPAACAPPDRLPLHCLWALALLLGSGARGGAQGRGRQHSAGLYQFIYVAQWIERPFPKRQVARSIRVLGVVFPEWGGAGQTSSLLGHHSSNGSANPWCSLPGMHRAAVCVSPPGVPGQGRLEAGPRLTSQNQRLVGRAGWRWGGEEEPALDVLGERLAARGGQFFFRVFFCARPSPLAQVKEHCQERAPPIAHEECLAREAAAPTGAHSSRHLVYRLMLAASAGMCGPRSALGGRPLSPFQPGGPAFTWLVRSLVRALAWRPARAAL